ncbi:unnamed protein product [Adineta ricciae]|uniref:Uncharacterized protein n=1 Tax=Adineta ricciae TaxID=249248 RepID=A0A815LX59_ADIRI|nr:unnamed protein product [Adineta ricciae]
MSLKAITGIFIAAAVVKGLEEIYSTLSGKEHDTQMALNTDGNLRHRGKSNRNNEMMNIIHGIHVIFEQPFALIVGFFLVVLLVFTALCFVPLFSQQSNAVSILYSIVFIATLSIMDRVNQKSTSYIDILNSIA